MIMLSSVVTLELMMKDKFFAILVILLYNFRKFGRKLIVKVFIIRLTVILSTKIFNTYTINQIYYNEFEKQIDCLLL